MFTINFYRPFAPENNIFFGNNHFPKRHKDHQVLRLGGLGVEDPGENSF